MHWELLGKGVKRMKQVFTIEEQEFIRGYASKLLAGVETTREEDARLYELRDKFIEEYEKEREIHGS